MVLAWGPRELGVVTKPRNLMLTEERRGVRVATRAAYNFDDSSGTALDYVCSRMGLIPSARLHPALLKMGGPMICKHYALTCSLRVVRFVLLSSAV